MLVAIGSKNPIKVAAAEGVFKPLFPDVQFVHLEVPSGVRGQPWGDLETRNGAINRARTVQQQADAEFGVGLEGGVLENEIGMFTCAWVAIAARDGRIGIGGGNNVQLPEAVAALVRDGLELGEAMDKLFKTQGLKHREGAIGTFTDGLVTRQDSFMFVLRLALAPFRAAQWYG
ncbi:MAG: inosine/xanthosine triphosphatase [Anaerolineae bacterium]|nr:inosine/xanthosine triphosphatase [Anaerolineae bacterium]